MRPMLASTPTTEDLERHLSEDILMASIKLDGIRAITTEKGLLSRTLKPIRNEYIQERLRVLPVGLDGELIVGNPAAPDVFNKTTSGVMSRGGEPNFKYHVFDIWNMDEAYIDRFGFIIKLIGLVRPDCYILEQDIIKTLAELEEFERQVLDSGYEGVIVRRPDAPYKFNRATNREGYLMKVKRYADSEAIVIGIKQKMHNANEAKTDALGLTKRSTSKEHKEPLEQVGAFMVKDLETGQEFQVHGFSHADAAKWWQDRDKLIGKIITYKHLPIGAIDAPRFPIFKGFRDPIDL